MEPTTEGTGGAEPVTPTPSQGAAPSDMKGMMAQLETLLDEFMVKKAPFQIPMNGKEVLVKIAPYLVIIAAVIAIPAILAALGLSAVLAPVALLGGHTWGIGAMVSLVASIAALGVELMAVPGLFKRTKSAWRLVFYATLISLVGSIVSFNIVGGLIGAVIGWYILFQVKELYKN